LHGFLSYLVKCAVQGVEYTIIGYGGKQVRDNIHSGDLVRIFNEFYRNPRKGEVFNIGGGERSNCSVLEAIAIIESKLGEKMKISFDSQPRVGDHKWYISDLTKLRQFFPNWDIQHNIKDIISEILLVEQGRR